ncbi:MAG: hypothetical protein ACXVA9_09175 [Bdellovibrionales bacterium]
MALSKANSDKPEELLQIDVFDGFVTLRFNAGDITHDVFKSMLDALKTQVSNGEKLVYLDFANSQEINPSYLTSLAAEISKLSTSDGLEVVLLSEPKLAAQFFKSELKDVTQVFERGPREARLLATRELLNEGVVDLRARLTLTMASALQVALQRWPGAAPVNVGLRHPEINPSASVISTSKINVDGHSVTLYLATSHATMKNMLKEIMHPEMGSEETVIEDGARELLNYVAAFFKQHLNSEDSVVETEAPTLLEPDQMLALLELEQDAHRVDTSQGPIDLWFEVNT